MTTTASLSRAPLLTTPLSKTKQTRGARVLHLAGHRWYYSGDDCIAYASPTRRMRRGWSHESWRRHGLELGCDAFPLVDAEEFEATLPTVQVTVRS